MAGRIGVSIVLYKTPAAAVSELVSDFLRQGASRVYLIDNSPLAFEFSRDWLPPPGVEVIRTGANLGYGRANNLAIAESVRLHEFHIVCNPDVQLARDAIATLLVFMRAEPDVGLCMPRIVSPEGELQYLCKRPPSALDLIARRFLPATVSRQRRDWHEMRDKSYRESFDAPCLSGCFMFFRSSVLARLGGFDERFFLYMEDFDISRRAAAISRTTYVPAATIVHAHSKASYTDWRLTWAHILSALRYFRKWGWTGG